MFRRPIYISTLFMILTTPLMDGGCKKKNDTGLMEETISKSELVGKKASRKTYEDKPWVEIDIPYIIGRPYSSTAKNILLRQAGEVRSEEKLPGLNGIRIHFGMNTEVKLIKDKVYFIRYNFPRPVSLVEALRKTGFPENISEFMNLSLELRLNNFLGLRRLRIIRVAKDSDRFKAVEAYKFIPQENY